MDQLTQAREELDALKPQSVTAPACSKPEPHRTPPPRGTIARRPSSAPSACRIPRFTGKSTPIKRRRGGASAQRKLQPATEPPCTPDQPQHCSSGTTNEAPATPHRTSSPSTSSCPPSGGTPPSKRHGSRPQQHGSASPATALSPWDARHHPLREHMQEHTATASLARRLFTPPDTAGRSDMLASILAKQVQSAKEHVQNLQWELQEARLATQRANAERDAAVTRYRNAVSGSSTGASAVQGAMLC